MADESAPSSLFESILNKPESERFEILNTMVSGSEIESEWLDFKAAGQVSDPFNNTWLTEEWAKYVSAFANTGGGLIVWGIQTKKENGKDYADKFNHVRDTAKFAARLDAMRIKVTYPPVNGIVNLAIADPGQSPGVGCVVSYIPNSQYKPHRAEYGERAYWIRIGDECGVLPHELLRQLFYPRLNTRMAIMVHGYESLPDAIINLSIINKGTSTAQDVFVTVEWMFPWGSQEGDRVTSNYSWNQSKDKIGHDSFEAKRPIHPTVEMDVCRIASKLTSVSPIIQDKFDLRVTVYARDCEPQFFRLEFPTVKLHNVYEAEAQAVHSLY